MLNDIGIEVLDMDGAITLVSGEQTIACRAGATVDALRDELDGFSQSILPWRDALAREGQVRRLAADKSITLSLKRALMEHVAVTKVLSAPERATTLITQFVAPPDWDLVDRLGDDFWDDDNPAGWLCTATVRTEDGAVIECSNASFESAEDRETMVRQIVADERLSLGKRKDIAVRIGRTPVQYS